VPDAYGLEKAAKLAVKLGQDFDPADTAAAAEKLHQVNFTEIAECLDLTQAGPRFVSGGYRLVNAFASPEADGENLVGFDELLDFWLMDLTHLTLIPTCYDLSDEQYGRLLNTFHARLNLMVDPYSHEESRDDVWEFY
jgi:hypothetical protein